MIRAGELTSLDEPMDDVPDEPEPEAEEPEPAAPIDQPVQPKPEEKQEMVTVEGGRRRGRRRVMKRKTVQDDEGYLGRLLFIQLY